MLAFWDWLYWVHSHHKIHKTNRSPLGFCKQVSYVYFLSFFVVKTHIRQDKNSLVRHINVLTPEFEYLIQLVFHLSFSRSPMSTKRRTLIQFLWHCILLLLKCPELLSCKTFFCRIVCSNYLRSLLWTSVLYHCFSSPRRGSDVSIPYLEHYELVHFSERLFCEKSHILIHIFQYFCL